MNFVICCRLSKWQVSEDWKHTSKIYVQFTLNLVHCFLFFVERCLELRRLREMILIWYVIFFYLSGIITCTIFRFLISTILYSSVCLLPDLFSKPRHLLPFQQLLCGLPCFHLLCGIQSSTFLVADLGRFFASDHTMQHIIFLISSFDTLSILDFSAGFLQ